MWRIFEGFLAKFYCHAFSGRFGQKGVRSGYLYQLLAYLKNLADPSTG
jgi:5-methylcytosine-specific restriction endonuclease McrBC regulatory subunit McrC